MNNVELPVVSVCVPVYNVEQYMERCARSLFEQSYDNVEFIFVDDCSLDSSLIILNNVVEEYPNRRNHVIRLRHERNRGLAAARNTAVAAASGDFIMHVDSDDWLEPDSIELLVRKQIETGADIVSGNSQAHYSDKVELLSEPDYSDKNQMMSNIIGMTLDHVLWRRIIRRSLYAENNILEFEGVDIGEDHYTLPRILYYASSFAKVDKVVYHYNRTNRSSYMNETGAVMEMARFNSNIKAVSILEGFFRDKNSRIICELEKIRTEYLNANLKKALVFGNREAYDIIVSEIPGKRNIFLMDSIPIIICKALHKITGISFRCLR